MNSNPEHAVACHGLHQYEGVYYLHQGRKATNFVGLRKVSPFVVVNPNRVKFCNHVIPTAAPLPDRVHWDIFLQLLKDPLVRAMLPVPKRHDAGCYYIDDPDDKLALYLTLLTRMSSPIHGVVKPVWTLDLKKLPAELSATNIQPIVWTQVRPGQQSTVGVPPMNGSACNVG